MEKGKDADETRVDPHAQMLRLVAKGFYRELINYGVKEAEVLTVAGHLLDNVVLKSPPVSKPEHPYNQLFTIRDIEDAWPEHRTLKLGDVTLSPLSMECVPQIAGWLEVPKVRQSFFPGFPRVVADLERHFQAVDREYLAITYGSDFVGIIGAESIDRVSSRVEMRKLVGEAAMRGKGIGKRATFLFLYHVFVVRRLHKVYMHSLDINIRNLNLNGNFGFWLEGVFHEDAIIDGERQDVVRMALTAPVWTEMFK